MIVTFECSPALFSVGELEVEVTSDSTLALSFVDLAATNHFLRRTSQPDCKDR